MNKFEQPIRTEIQWNGTSNSSMSIIGESEKAYLFIVSKLIRKGTSMSSSYQEREQWIPKSVWDNDKNFETYNLQGNGLEIKTFNPPYFLK
jgi:hypothetical protein